MSVVITVPLKNARGAETHETVILLRYSNTSEPMPPMELERKKLAVAKGRGGTPQGIKTSELTERRVGE